MMEAARLLGAPVRRRVLEVALPMARPAVAAGAALALMEGAMHRIATMVAGWIRVGFIQGNFNADNCLIGGRTMDYGPFGFLDVYVSRCLAAHSFSDRRSFDAIISHSIICSCIFYAYAASVISKVDWIR